jgi:serine/threonine-protein kinase RsbW
MPDFDTNKELCTVSDTSQLGKIRDFVIQKAKLFGFDDKDSQKIALAVDEACSNLIKHAFKFDNSKKLCVIVSSDSKDLVVHIKDDSKAFDPTEMQSPDMAEYLRQYRRGGLGIHLMKLVMDKINYIPSDSKNPHNILELRKTLN